MADYYYYNTNGDSLVGPSRFRRLINEHCAATSGDRRYGEELGRLAPGDILLMYENQMGVVAVGTVREQWDRESHRSRVFYDSGEQVPEYRIKVDWFDLSENPIDKGELRERLGFISSRTIQRIVKKKDEVERMIAERLHDRSSLSPSRLTKVSRQTPPSEVGESVKDPPARMRCTTIRIVRDTAEARRLKELYEYHCQICGERIELGPSSFYAEVHHIHPLGGEHQGLDEHHNMLVVCPTHHAMFDLGVAEFDSENTVIISDKFHSLNLKHRLAPENLDYHNDKIVRRHDRGGAVGNDGGSLGISQR
ncbi:MAG TPA: HNH endonuclease [Isosphaeraceae bacterium]|nr:HNH endonuclease [Isosphaeraceae bacterium]